MSDDTKTILVVDDDESLRRTIVRTLAKHGYAVLEAGDAYEARTALMDSLDTVD